LAIGGCTGGKPQQEKNGSIDVEKTIADIDTNPVALKGELEWRVTDVTDPQTVCLVDSRVSDILVHLLIIRCSVGVVVAVVGLMV
jgi:hypothetical protein